MSVDPNPQKPEEIKPEYNENTAILKEKLLIGLIVTDKVPGIFAHLTSRESIIMAKGEIDAYLNMILVEGDLRAKAARSGKIIPAKGGIMGFARRFK